MGSSLPPVLFTLYSQAQKALDESIEVVSSLVSLPYKLNKLSTFWQQVVYVTISDEETVAAFKEAAGWFIGLDWWLVIKLHVVIKLAMILTI